MTDTIKQFLEMHSKLIDNNISELLNQADYQLSLPFYNELIKVLVDCDIIKSDDIKLIGNSKDFPNKHIDWDNPNIYEDCQELLISSFEKHTTYGSGVQVNVDNLYDELQFNGFFHLWDLDLIHQDRKVSFVSISYSLEDPDGYLVPEILCYDTESTIILRLTENNRDENLGGYIDDVGMYFNAKRLRDKLNTIKNRFDMVYDYALQNAKEEE